ncbi:MAG TPA: restriction endonuclease [Patescibacteria group bacterium]|nr:restriction endonuclease [Patescibacteria group bacterium]
MRQAKGPEFIRFFRPILEVLRELGGSGTASEIVDRSLEIAKVSEAEQEAVNKNGLSRVKNQVHWARQYLVWSGYLDSSRRGVWSLTNKGTTVDLSAFNALEVFKIVQSTRAELKRDKKQGESHADEPVPIDTEVKDHRSALLDLIKSLSPGGFERLSQRLLRESGFQHVTVTGKSSDGGIDGIGTLQVNSFVSFNVLFQCKRYQGAVTPSQVRDFRGAMMGRADKGLIITTGTFTLEAKKEARRDGVPPIELVDGDILIDMFEKLELGLIPKRDYDIDEKFFEEYRK